MRALLGALVLGHIRHDRLRSLVTIVAVALGVAIAVAIDLANATAVASFATSVNVISNHVNLQILGTGAGFADRTILRVQHLAGVRYASPAIEDGVTIGAQPGRPLSGEILRVLGVDMLRPLPGAETGALATPGFAARGSGTADPWTLVNGRGAFVSARVAAAYRLAPGAPMHVLAAGRPVTLTVAGVIPPQAAGVDSSVVFVDIATAQEIFGKLGRLDRIDLVVDPGVLAATAAAIRAVIPPGTRAVEPAVRTGEIRRMLRSFQLNLAALSYIALLVGMYLIYNTVAISVVQRRAEIGTLRALGARRRDVFRAFVAEGLVFGVAGSLAGLALGAVLAQFSVAAVSRTVDTLYVASHADRVVYEPFVLLRVFAIGVAMALVSAAIPAREAAATAPALAMRASGFERRRTRVVPRAAAWGAVLCVAAGLFSRAPAIDDVPVFGYAAGLAIILGASLFAPAAVVATARGGAAWFGRRFPAARLAAGNLGASPVRNSVAVASLMVAIAMMVAIAVLIGSFRTTVVAWANDTLKADLFVRPLGLADASDAAGFSPAAADAVRRVRGVAAVETFRGITIPFRGRLVALGAVDFAALGRRQTLRFIGRADPAQLARTLPGSSRVLISDPFAVRFGLRPGARFTIDSPSGPLELDVAAVYNDYSSDAGVVLLDRRTFVRRFRDDSINSLAVYARRGADISALRSAVVRSLLPLRVDTQTTRELRELVLAIFNRTFAITYALYVISIAIAVMGVVSTLFALVLERRREIGILRYLGLRTADVRRMVYYEAALIGLLGGTGGVGVGVLLSLLLIFVINRQAFGWLIELHVPYDFLVFSVVLVVVAALLAAVYPAFVAARIRTADAVRAE